MATCARPFEARPPYSHTLEHKSSSEQILLYIVIQRSVIKLSQKAVQNGLRTARPAANIITVFVLIKSVCKFTRRVVRFCFDVKYFKVDARDGFILFLVKSVFKVTRNVLR